MSPSVFQMLLLSIISESWCGHDIYYDLTTDQNPYCVLLVNSRPFHFFFVFLHSRHFTQIQGHPLLLQEEGLRNRFGTVYCPIPLSLCRGPTPTPHPPPHHPPPRTSSVKGPTTLIHHQCLVSRMGVYQVFLKERRSTPLHHLILVESRSSPFPNQGCEFSS